MTKKIQSTIPCRDATPDEVASMEARHSIISRSVNPPEIGEEEREQIRMEFAEHTLNCIQRALAKRGLTLKIEALQGGDIHNTQGNA